MHNLEHGGIVLLYQCDGTTCASLADQITAIYQRLPQSKWGNVKLLATPYTKMDAP